MTREIKFRIVEMNTDGTITMHYDIMNNGAYGCFLISAINEPETYGVMQFTGLLDKNGNEIYEGDIIKIIYRDGESDIGSIFYDIESLRFSVRINDCAYGLGGRNDIEIIGNIYENKELLNHIESYE